MGNWKNEETIVLWLAIGLTVLLGLLIFILLLSRIYIKKRLADAKKLTDLQLEHQKKLVEDSIKVQESERERIAADLHDDLIGKLNAVLIMNNLHKYTEASDLLKNTIQIARSISHDLHPPMIEESTLIELIDTSLLGFASQISIEHVNITLDDMVLPFDIKLQTIRIIQEIINNTLKHAEATQITILLRTTPTYLGISIKDNGKGFDTVLSKKGLGLSNIEMRTQSLGGNYKLHSKKGKGTCYFFLFSLKKQTNASED